MKFKLSIVLYHAGSTDQPGNKMDATNLATIFAPNLLHTLPEDVAEKAAAAAAATSPTSPYGGSKGGGGGGGGGGAAFLSSTTSSFSAMATGSPERMEYVAAVRYVISPPNEPKLDQNKDSPVGWLACLAGDFLFVLTALWLLWSSLPTSIFKWGFARLD